MHDVKHVSVLYSVLRRMCERGGAAGMATSARSANMLEVFGPAAQINKLVHADLYEHRSVWDAFKLCKFDPSMLRAFASPLAC